MKVGPLSLGRTKQQLHQTAKPIILLRRVAPCPSGMELLPDPITGSARTLGTNYVVRLLT